MRDLAIILTQNHLAKTAAVLVLSSAIDWAVCEDKNRQIGSYYGHYFEGLDDTTLSVPLNVLELWARSREKLILADVWHSI